jgi:hypothetical protein
MIEYKYETKVLYRVQIDYMDKEAKDLLQRISCALKMFKAQF